MEDAAVETVSYLEKVALALDQMVEDTTSVGAEIHLFWI